MSILLADDDVHLATFLSKSLESEGYAVHTALDEPSVFAELKRQNYRLIILDLNFGQTDGLRLLQKLRSAGLETPVMVLSARDQVSDRIESFNLGADDYVTKPFSFQELAARANAILRRKMHPSLNVLRVEDLELDPATRKVRRSGREVKLSPKELDLLQLLMRHGGETVSRQYLLEQCWGTHETDSNLVDVYVNYLRKKIESSGPEKLIHTVRGAGYRLGKPAPAGGSAALARGRFDSSASAARKIAGPPPNQPASSSALQTSALRTLVHSVVHDLAQPLTTVRCFLEMLAMRKGGEAVQPAELKTVEQQADRAIALTRGISALVREPAEPVTAWISLETLFNDLFSDFTVLLQSGLLTLERQWDPSIRVSGSPVLRQLLVLLVSKLAGRNTRPLVLTIAAEIGDGRCRLNLHWRPADSPQHLQQSAAGILGRELSSLHELARSLGGKLSVKEDQPEIALEVPAAPQASAARAAVEQNPPRSA